MISYSTKAAAILYAKSIERLSASYSHICGLDVTHSAPDHVVLESSQFQLVIVAIPEPIARSIAIATPLIDQQSPEEELLELFRLINQKLRSPKD